MMMNDNNCDERFLGASQLFFFKVATQVRRKEKKIAVFSSNFNLDLGHFGLDRAIVDG
jgi:hypothetical protein